MSKTIQSKNFTFETFEPKETKNKKIVRKTIRIKRNEGKLTYADLKLLYEDILKKQKVVAEDVAICVMSERYLTIKSFEEDEMKEWDSNEYYQDKAKNTEKFNEYSYCDIIIRN